MKKQFNLNLNFKKYRNLNKGILIFSELLVLFLILISSLVVIDNEFSDQNNASNVQNSDLNQPESYLSPVIAPVNPEFTSQQQNKLFSLNAQSPNGSLNGHEKGLVPSPVDLQNIDHSTSAFRSLSTPAYYDLRNLNKVTSVKDQGMTGSCWAFASYASLESYFKPSESPDFSENNLKNILASTSSEGFDFAEGGNMFMSTSYLARWSGPVQESDDPYSDSSSYSSTGLPARKHAQDIIFLSDRQDSLDNQEIKSAIQTYGAIYTSMCYDDSYFSYATSSYYYDGNYDSNHAVAIVGWNDSYDKNKFAKVPPGNGAFIVKNSWSTGWGDNGYFYVSYYDKRIGTENAVFKAESVGNYNSIYQYDPLGWVLSFGYDKSHSAWGSNIFTAKSSEVLKAVSFYTTDENCNYEVYIYTNPNSNPIDQASLALTQNGVISNAGYHTIGLNSEVPLQAGQKFAVVLKLTTPGYYYPLAIEYPYSGYSSKAKANAGESFISANGQTWTDVTTYYRNTNVCIKAFTDQGNGLILPTANFSATPLSGTVPLQVTFTDTSTGSPNSWYWNFGDNTYSTEQNPTHTYSVKGTYTVSLTATNNAGSDIETKSKHIVVNALQVPVANFIGNVTKGTLPLSVNFTDTSTRSPTSWYWSFGDGTSSIEQNPVHVYSKAGKYTVSLKASNAAGSNTVRKTSYITVSAPTPPVAGFSSSVRSGSMPLNVSFTDTSTRSPTIWYWDFGDGSSSTEQNPVHVYNKAGRFTITLKASNNGGSSTLRRSNYITVTAPAPPVAGFSSSVRSGSMPLSVSFTDTSTRSPTIWYWDFGDGSSSTEQNPVHVYNKTGRFTITLKASSTAGSGTLRRSNYITVTAPAPPVAGFSSVRSGSMPLSVSFTDTSTRSPTIWYWNFGDGSSSTEQNPVHVYNKTGRFTITLKASNTAGSSTLRRTNYITVTAPKPPTSAFAANKVSGKAPLTVTFTDTSSGTPTSWSWDFGDGTQKSTLKNPTHTFTKVGKYTVSLTTRNAYGSNTVTKRTYVTVSK